MGWRTAIWTETNSQLQSHTHSMPTYSHGHTAACVSQLCDLNRYKLIEEKLQLSDYLQWTFLSCTGPMKVRQTDRAYKGLLGDRGRGTASCAGQHRVGKGKVVLGKGKESGTTG